MTSVLRQTSAFMAHQKPVVGDMKMSFVGYDHLGWMLCNGASLPIIDNNVNNSLLFKVIGYQFGGSGNFFNLPNPAGRVAGVVGNNSIVGTITHPPGQVIGEEEHILLYTEMPAHNHDTAGRTTNLPAPGPVGYTSTESTGIYLTDPGHTHTGTTNSSGSSPGVQDVIDTVVAANTTINVAAQGSHTHTFTTANNSSNVTLTDPDHRHSIAVNGMDQPHNNMQPTLFMGNMFIYSGVPTLGYWPYTIGKNPPEYMTPILNPPLI